MLLYNARVIDGTGRRPRERSVVRVDGGRIAEVAAADGPAPGGAIDLDGRTLPPGLIDAHAHVSSDVSRSPGFGPRPPLAGELPRRRELGYFVLVLAEDPEPAQMTAQELGAIVDEANRLGVRVAAHVEGLEGARLAISAGVNTIEHGLSLHREPRLLEIMAEQGIVLVPTLSTFHDLADRFTGSFAPALVEQAKRQREDAYSTLQAALAEGVTLAMGHDSGPPGENAIELVRMVDGGLSALQGIVAATHGSASALGLGDVGSVVAGAAADLLVIDGDPLVDVHVLNEPASIWLVVKDGVAVAGRTRTAENAPA